MAIARLGHVDGVGRGRAEPAAGDPERVAGSDLVERQAGEGWPRPGSPSRRACRRASPRRVVRERDAHAALCGRLHIAVGVLDRGLQAEAAVDDDAGGRLLRDHQLRGRRGGHGNGAGGRAGRRRCWRPRACSRTRPVVSVRPEKVATPPDAVTVSVPPSVAPPGLFASATVTVPLKEESRLPELSSAWTVRPKGCPR